MTCAPVFLPRRLRGPISASWGCPAGEPRGEQSAAEQWGRRLAACKPPGRACTRGCMPAGLGSALGTICGYCCWRSGGGGCKLHPRAQLRGSRDAWGSHCVRRRPRAPRPAHPRPPAVRAAAATWTPRRRCRARAASAGTRTSAWASRPPRRPSRVSAAGRAHTAQRGGSAVHSRAPCQADVCWARASGAQTVWQWRGGDAAAGSKQRGGSARTAEAEDVVEESSRRAGGRAAGYAALAQRNWWRSQLATWNAAPAQLASCSRNATGRRRGVVHSVKHSLAAQAWAPACCGSSSFSIRELRQMLQHGVAAALAQWEAASPLGPQPCGGSLAPACQVLPGRATHVCLWHEPGLSRACARNTLPPSPLGPQATTSTTSAPSPATCRSAAASWRAR